MANQKIAVAELANLPLYYEQSAAFRCVGFLPQMLIRSTEVSATTKLSAEHETPPIGKVMLAADFLLIRSTSLSICPKFLL